MFFLLPNHVSTIRYVPGLRLLYLNNPKAACTQVKTLLWRAEDRRTGRTTFAGNVHGANLPGDPMLRHLSPTPEVGSVASFSIIRNPFRRALSAYHNKIAPKLRGGRPRPRNTGAAFEERYGLEPGQHISFTQFLRLLAVDAPEGRDPHFCPQTVNLLAGYAPPGLLFRLEDMATANAWLTEQVGAPLDSEARNASRAGEEFAEAYSDPLAVSLVRELYGDDFAAFGYPEDPGAATRKLPPITTRPDATLRIARLSQLMRVRLPAAAGPDGPDNAGPPDLPDAVLEEFSEHAPEGWAAWMRILRDGRLGAAEETEIMSLTERRRMPQQFLNRAERLAKKERRPALLRRLREARLDFARRCRAMVPDLRYRPVEDVVP